MFKLRPTKAFEKDLRRIKRQGKDRTKLDIVIRLLMDGEPLPRQYHDHALRDSKSYKNKRECHIEPDWLLIYEYDNDMLILILTRTGSHSDLF